MIYIYIYIYLKNNNNGVLWDIVDRFGYLKVSCAIVLIIPNEKTGSTVPGRKIPINDQQAHSLQIFIQYIYSIYILYIYI